MGIGIIGVLMVCLVKANAPQPVYPELPLKEKNISKQTIMKEEKLEKHEKELKEYIEEVENEKPQMKKVMEV